jgi:uncharacterized membrane protein
MLPLSLFNQNMALFTEEEQEMVTAAIADAEKLTSGEIRVAIEKHCPEEAYDRAVSYFYELNMEKTTQHNGVLIYLAYEDHKFAIIGDKGINKVVPEDFWETTQVAMKAHFASGNYASGIIAGVRLAGEKLAMYFPYDNGDVNELPNDIVYMDRNKLN